MTRTSKIIFSLLLIALLNFQAYGVDGPLAEEESSQSSQQTEPGKRERDVPELRASESPRGVSADTPEVFQPFKKKHRDRQFKALTRKSLFLEGEEAARLRWVSTLDIFLGSKKPEKYVKISSNIHDKLAYLGNYLRAFAEVYPKNDMYQFKRNVFVPHVSFVVKRSYDDVCEKVFVPGSYVNFDEENYPESPMVFFSGGNSTPYDALYQYNLHRKHHNYPKDVLFELPVIRATSGEEVERKTGKKMGSDTPSGCTYHTEEMFYNMLLAYPQVILEIANKVLLPIDQILHVVFDSYSFWDVCRPCQKRFRTEYFQGVLHQKLEEVFAPSDFAIPEEAGLLPVFRVSSYKQYHDDSLADMTEAGGGSQVEGGFDAKVISQTQVVLSSRKQTGTFDYPTIYHKVKNRNVVGK
ncbi:MAG: hypothetical protein K2Y18_01560 [Alphaproteobacteria bacterium]|nr:hypothetical protein [Alphaproteobacteria bacterium]